jgi:hypothetical protein
MDVVLSPSSSDFVGGWSSIFQITSGFESNIAVVKKHEKRKRKV